MVVLFIQRSWTNTKNDVVTIVHNVEQEYDEKGYRSMPIWEQHWFDISSLETLRRFPWSTYKDGLVLMDDLMSLGRKKNFVFIVLAETGDSKRKG